GLGVAAAAGLFVLFGATRLGLAVRAVVDDAALLDVTGESPTRVRRHAWMLGSIFAAVSGVLFASVQQQVQVDVLALLIVQAFGAAALARCTSLPGAFAGGLAIGMAQSLISKEATRIPALVGLDLNIPFLVLFIVLLVTPKGRLRAPAQLGSALAGGPRPGRGRDGARRSAHRCPGHPPVGPLPGAGHARLRHLPGAVLLQQKLRLRRRPAAGHPPAGRVHLRR